TAVACEWELQLGDPYLPGGQCAWVAPARSAVGDEMVLKVAWRHPEAEREADGLLHWDGDGAIRCYATRQLEHSTVLLLERCTPGQQLKASASEPDQDEIIAALLHRLWSRAPQPGHRFRSLASICAEWADAFE